MADLYSVHLKALRAALDKGQAKNIGRFLPGSADIPSLAKKQVMIAPKILPDEGKGIQIGENLTGMVFIRHGVDHRAGGICRQPLKKPDVSVSYHQQIGPVCQVTCHISQILFFIQRFRRKKDGLAAQRGNALFEGHAGAQARGREEKHRRFSLQRLPVFSGPEFVRQAEHLINSFFSQIRKVNQMFHIYHLQNPEECPKGTFFGMKLSHASSCP